MTTKHLLLTLSLLFTGKTLQGSNGLLRSILSKSYNSTSSTSTNTYPIGGFPGAANPYVEIINGMQQEINVIRQQEAQINNQIDNAVTSGLISIVPVLIGQIIDEYLTKRRNAKNHAKLCQVVDQMTIK